MRMWTGREEGENNEWDDEIKAEIGKRKTTGGEINYYWMEGK